MGKSFNDDVFNNGFNINGLNISNEAIEENQKKTTPTIDLSKINLSEAKKEMEKAKRQETKPIEQLEDLQKELDRVEKEKPTPTFKEPISENEYYTKKTMIFKTDYLDIIMGLSLVKDMQIKDVLNQVIELGLEKLKEIDETLIPKAIKENKKTKGKKDNNSLF